MIRYCNNSWSTVFVYRSRRSALPPPARKIVCLITSNIKAEQLRLQLDNLNTEADNTRAKANNARLRLLRLSEAAEKLQRQALTSVRTGKENDARDLLLQKKKLMQALEKSKSRIELLDELSAKLNEAISVKETQLVSAVTLDLEDHKEDASPPVRIVSPKEEEASRKSDEFEDLETDSHVGREDQISQSEVYSHNDAKEADVASSLKGISSYEDFLEHLDQQLYNVEAELVTVLRFSTLVLEGEEKSKNLKLQQTEEILEAVGRIRKRIASIHQTKVGML